MGRQASIAIWMAVMLPGLIMGLSLGVEVTSWAAVQVSLQRAADVAAIAGAINYKATTNKQTAATFAARIAQLNGGTGTASPSWNAGTSTLTDNLITAQVVTGWQTTSNTALKVTVQKVIPAGVSKAFSSTASYTVTATGTAELISTTSAGSGGQPCVVALAGNTGVTTGTNLTISGTNTIDATSCTIRSNTGMTITGTNNVTAQAIYVGGTLTNTGSNSITGTVYQNQGQIPDPYASVTEVQTALTTANSASGATAISCTGSLTCDGPSGKTSCTGSVCTIQPGTYAGLSVIGSGTVNFIPGRYTFTGNVLFDGLNTIVASGVTFVMAASTSGTPNTLQFNANSNITFSAATTAGAINGQIPGILFASTSTGASVNNGSNTSTLTGVVYYPNGTWTDNGSNISNTPGCYQLIAKTITVTGSANFGTTNCAVYGTTGFTSVSGTTTRSAQIVH